MSMEPFTLQLSSSRQITGLLSFPSPQPSNNGRPLVVLVHGGTYAASYFNFDSEHSIASVSVSLGLPVICITRPRYGSSSPLPPLEGNGSYLEQTGRDLEQNVLPAVWKAYGGSRTNTTSIVIYGHSIGAIVTLIAAATHTENKGTSYPLSGIVTAGIGSAPHPEWPKKAATLTPPPDSSGLVTWTTEMKNDILLSSDLNLCSKSIVDRHGTDFNHSSPIQELMETRTFWRKNWRELVSRIQVPHLHGVPEFDRLREATVERLEEFKAAFTSCPNMQAKIIPMAPHSVELSFLGRAWMIQALGFALECAVVQSLKERNASTSRL